MADFKMLLPAMGEGIIEATITKWLVSKGQHIHIDQPLVEVATDKVDSEIPSPVEGIIKRLVYREGEIPRIGEVIALIETEQQEFREMVASEIDMSEVKPLSDEAGLTPERKPVMRTSVSNSSLLIKSLAKQRGVGLEELDTIKGTGPAGLVVKEDLMRYLRNGRQKSNNTKKQQLPDKMKNGNIAVSEVQSDNGDRIIEMSRMRKLIAEHMLLSKETAVHVTSFLEADITPLVTWREENKESFQNREKAKLTFTPVFIEAVAMALKEFPGINISASGNSIIFHKNLNIGLATALADGNLIVPVIKNADHENLGGLSRKVTDLANRARNGSLLPEEIKGGTFTITNIGQYNSLTGTPIINQPQSAIMAFGTIMKKPWAVKTLTGYGVAVRDIIMLSLTYDHRVIDGALGGSFLSRVASLLENFNIKREL
jgi:2-oxoglutarate dehydrogenase E2 component (dihydrolipoamide succinyltransferase)